MIIAFLLTMLLTMVFIRIATHGGRKAAARNATYQDQYTSGLRAEQAAFYDEQAAFYDEQAAFYEEQTQFYQQSAPTTSPAEPTDQWADTWETEDEWDASDTDVHVEHVPSDDDYAATFDEGFLHEVGIDPRSFR